ncbi:hypothetical protein PoB_007300800 [Plakobranchus ocellatus]|uniref:Uncharacterized protein n=1 Tax=Plakobranchus ocellatus TaxID=259542 RepID=A0AAV4DQC0_9GAST|nr:hypothetical protein PoB_007300800 [Plakobranchus ocellatus]
MAEANVNIASQLQSIANSLISQQAAANVPTFDGREKSINNWLEELDKLQRVYGLTDESVKTLAWTRAKGTVSSFLGRIMQESPLLAWALVKKELEMMFRSVVGPQQAFGMLIRSRQRAGDVTSYSDQEGLWPRVGK